MTRVFLTGASGFVGAHILRILLDRGHTVLASVRSQTKADQIRRGYPGVPSSTLDFVVVEDITLEHAYDEALSTTPPVEVVIHAASPLNLNADLANVERDVLRPAVLGTTRLLDAVHAHGSSVRRVVVTSSVITIMKPVDSKYLFSDSDWNYLTDEQTHSSGTLAYAGSKIAAERAVWSFLEERKPSFSVTTILPPVVLGPVRHDFASLDSINDSGRQICNFINGEFKEELPESQFAVWVDVRDAALAHVRAFEVAEAGNKRFIVYAGTYSNREVANILWDHFPALRSKLPGSEVSGGEFPEAGVNRVDNEPSRKILGINYRSLEDSVVDMTGSLIGLYKP